MLFRAKTANQLEERLYKLVDEYNDKLNKNVDSIENDTLPNKILKLGLFSGLAIGGAGLVSALSQFDSQGTAIMAGSAALAAGLGYSGISTLYTNYKTAKENKQEMPEEERLKILSKDMNSKFFKKMAEQTDYRYGMNYNQVLEIESALKSNNMEEAKDVIKRAVSKVSFDQTKPEEEQPRKRVFKNFSSDSLMNRVDDLHEKHKEKTNLKYDLGKASQMENRIIAGVGMASIGAMYGVAGLVTLDSLPMLGAGVAVSVASLGYTGISALLKNHIESKNNLEYEQINSIVKNKDKENLLESSTQTMKKYKNTV